MSGRQEEIIRVAVRLIAQRGIQGLTMKNLAAELGITEPAIYRHFSGKGAIVEGIFDRFEEGAREVLTKGGEGLTGVERFMRSRFEELAKDPDLARVLFAEEFFQDDPMLAERMRRMMHSHKERISELLAEAIKRGEVRDDIEPEMLFRIVMGPTRLLVKQWCLSGFAFDLTVKGGELWIALEKVLRRNQA